MRLKGVIKPLEENESFKRLMSDIEAKKVVEVEGLSDSSRSYLISCLYENNDKSILPKISFENDNSLMFLFTFSIKTLCNFFLKSFEIVASL